jgi:hypothetical protein
MIYDFNTSKIKIHLGIYISNTSFFLFLHAPPFFSFLSTINNSDEVVFVPCVKHTISKEALIEKCYRRYRTTFGYTAI